MFSEPQIQEFKVPKLIIITTSDDWTLQEAFNMIDQNKDGFIDHDDLVEMLTSLGKDANESYIEEMLKQATGTINFTMFLTLFGEKMTGSDPEETILNAFACFDPDDTGFVSEDHLRDLMTSMGDRWTDEQVDELFYGAPRQNGQFNYREFTKMIKHGKKEEDSNNPNL